MIASFTTASPTLTIASDDRVDRKRARSVGPDTPATQAARQLLKTAVKNVADGLRTLRDEGVDDASGVHQVRVSTRRAEASLLAFSSLIPRKRARRLRDRLAAIRRCAGEVRRCDVHSLLLTDLRETVTPQVAPVVDALTRRIARDRRRASASFERLLTRARVRDLKETTRSAMDRVRDEENRTLCTLAERVLPARAAAMDVLCRGPAPAPEELHELRIAGKKARYVLEVMASCLPADDFAPLYTRVEQFQERLGAYNDDHELIALFDEAIDRADRLAQKLDLPREQVLSDLVALRDAILARRDQRRDEFLAWWGGDEARAMIDALTFKGPRPLPAINVEAAGSMVKGPLAC